MRTRLALSMLAGVALLAACATNPVSGDRELALVSEAQEIQIGKDVAAQAERQFGLVEDLIARRPDIRLLTAIDGSRGIEIARASLPDMILMDINLPGISGIEAMKILREDTATAHIPVVALSGNAIPRDIRKGLEAGFFGYLTKPINVNEFMDTVDATLKFAKAEAARADPRVSPREQA